MDFENVDFILFFFYSVLWLRVDVTWCAGKLRSPSPPHLKGASSVSNKEESPSRAEIFVAMERVDPTDGNSYTLDEFFAFCGQQPLGDAEVGLMIHHLIQRHPRNIFQ